MPVRRSKVLLVKWIFENQHKLQTVRWCSSSLRYKELEESAQALEHVAPHAAAAAPDVKPRPYRAPETSFKHDDLQVTLAAPYQLQRKPDAPDLGFGKYFTDHMLKIQYHKQLGGWQKPEITPFEPLSIHPAAKALHYAIQLFEGLKAYRGVDDKIRLFRPDLNMRRMNLAAERSGLPMFDGDELIKCIKRLIQIDQEWVPHSETSTLYIRPTLIGTEATFGIMAPESALLFVILSPVSAYYKASDDGAVSIYADPSVVRAFPGGVGNRKVGSNYGPTIDATARAAQMGHHQVLWLFGPNHELTEVGAMNIFMVYINEHGEKQLSTPPLNGLILPGVTRQSILELASEWDDLTVKEEVITMDRVIELNNSGRLLEMFGSGTAVVISPISRMGFIDQEIYIPTMKQTRPVFQRIKDTLLAIQYGHIEHPYSHVIS
ncbi:Branched-chain-amino-acid aminotransferase, cytosolic [Papilio machaon]|uniref:Branched-chain-amino-acid aminotransferase n=1 Tax=Papilio machaon TaxID=76193 RepID=A0A194RLK0_PAPMA|nr:branched-chain-amino-acid aminotransferase, cytosolic [Papilio machaon]KPJ16861.1 Branched-chain-amino-acid aminotransferase, cytosolic [Papilio machaon]